MEGNGVHLKFAKVYLENVGQAEQQFKLVEASSTIQIIEHLIVELFQAGGYNRGMIALLKRRLPDLCNNLAYLIQLTVKHHEFEELDLLISIVSNVNSLE
jgi:hypothetical protein